MQGALAGILGCTFGVIGIFAFGFVFVPLAAACAVVGLIRGIGGKSAAGIGTSLLAGALSVFGFITSPSLWLLTAGLLVASHLPPPSSPPATQRMTSAPWPPTPQMQAPPPPRFTHVPAQAPASPAAATYCLTESSVQAIEQCQQYYARNPEVHPPEPSFVRGSSEALAQAKAQSTAAMTECRNLRLSGELKTYVASAQCSNPRIVAAFERAGYRYMDLIVDYTTKRLELSEATDQGRLTEAQASAELAQFYSGLEDRARLRDRGMR
jgi:hypothetical protein